MAKRAIILIFSVLGLLSLAYGQTVPSEKEKAPKKKEIKNVPSAETKSKPAKISSSARPNSGKSLQPVPAGKAGKTPARGKPPGVGKPPGN